MALFLELEAGDVVNIGPHTTVRMEAKSGKRTRLRIESTEDVKQVRSGEAPPAPAAIQRHAAEPPQVPAQPAAEGKTTFLRRQLPVA